MQHYFNLLVVTFVLLLVKSSTGEECVGVEAIQSAVPCCNVHLLFPSYQFGKACDLEHRHLLESGDRTNWSLCYLKCFAEKAGAIVGNTIHVEQYYKYANYFQYPISQAYRTAIERCSLQKFAAGTENGKWKCSPLASNFDTCLKSHLVFTCPVELRNNDEVCHKYLTGAPICKS